MESFERGKLAVVDEAVDAVLFIDIWDIRRDSKWFIYFRTVYWFLSKYYLRNYF